VGDNRSKAEAEMRVATFVAGLRAADGCANEATNTGSDRHSLKNIVSATPSPNGVLQP
jgi:hypothetical protein